MTDELKRAREVLSAPGLATNQHVRFVLQDQADRLLNAIWPWMLDVCEAVECLETAIGQERGQAIATASVLRDIYALRAAIREYLGGDDA